jgi:Protein of unknown function (DUF1656)
MLRELSIDGVLVSPLLPYFVATIPVFWLVDKLLQRFGCYRCLWHPVDVCAAKPPFIPHCRVSRSCLKRALSDRLRDQKAVLSSSQMLRGSIGLLSDPRGHGLSLLRFSSKIRRAQFYQWFSRSRRARGLFSCSRH